MLRHGEQPQGRAARFARPVFPRNRRHLWCIEQRGKFQLRATELRADCRTVGGGWFLGGVSEWENERVLAFRILVQHAAPSERGLHLAPIQLAGAISSLHQNAH